MLDMKYVKSRMHGKGWLAVLTGWAVWAVTAFLGMVLLRGFFYTDYSAQGITASAVLNLAHVFMDFFFYLLSGFLTATLLRDDVRLYVCILAGIHLFISFNIQFSYWRVHPLWYHLLAWSFASGATVLGGYLKQQFRNEVF